MLNISDFSTVYVSCQKHVCMTGYFLWACPLTILDAMLNEEVEMNRMQRQWTVYFESVGA